MRLTKKHIGQLFDVEGADGTWAHMLVDVKNKDLLFYAFDGKFWIEGQNEHDDWRPYQPPKPDKKFVKYGWSVGKRS